MSCDEVYCPMEEVKIQNSAESTERNKGLSNDLVVSHYSADNYSGLREIVRI